MREIRLGRPYFSETDIEKINSDVSGILRTGWLTSGVYASLLEERFRKVAGTRYAVALSSGTAALHALTSFLELERADEVVVPSNTFASTANAVIYVGARVALADCDPNTFNVTAETIDSCVTESTKCVIITHIAGNPCEMGEIIKLCGERNITLVEDAAHAAGSLYRGRSCGSLGAGAAFSFYPTKVMTTGEGGMLTTNSRELSEYARLFRNVGRKSLGHGPILIVGYNYRMSDIHAAVGLNQLSHLEEFVQKRNELAGVYDEELQKINWVEPQKIEPHSRSSYYSYIVRITGDNRISRDRLMQRLRKNGVETTIMFRPIHSQPAFRKLRLDVPCPNAEMVGTRTIVLPLHVGMSAEDVIHVCRIIRRVSSA